MRRAAKKDTVQGDIVRALRQAGASVLVLNSESAPDLLVGLHGVNHCVECKSEGGTLTPAQVKTFNAWRGARIEIAHNIEEALRIIGSIS